MSADTLQPLSLIHSLLQPEVYDPPADQCTLIETHISWVILAGPYAYKIKKSVNLGFLDFSTLAKRHFYCQEELRLNKRLAPALYLSVVPITGTFDQPQWGGDGEAIEYAVKMRAFPQEVQLDRLLARGALQASQIDLLARHIAHFHKQIDVADAMTPYGNPERVLQPVEENFKQIRQHVQDSRALRLLDELEFWSGATAHALHSFFVGRKSAGFVRECHGDMHLRNIAWIDDSPVLFDCIEFSPSLRWIDVMSDVAFLVMDLQDRKQPEMARCFLNRYLEQTGDYAGVGVLRFYQVYRALVRAKIDAIRAHQPAIGQEEHAAAEKDFFEYVHLALTYVRTSTPQLIITRGMSASGKSTISQLLLEQLGAIRLRSDVERKRLFGLQPEDDGQAAPGEGIYSPEATQKTYRKLEELATQILDAGYPVIVDAVFLHHEEREQFRQLAKSRQAPFVILQCTADIETLYERILQRTNDVSDADLKVLDMQHAKWQPLQKHEHIYTVSVNTAAPIDIYSLAGRIKTKLISKTP